MNGRIIGPFFFVEATVSGRVHLDMLEQFLYPQVTDMQPNIIFQQDGAPPPWWSLEVRRSLSATFQDRWIGRSGPIRWPPRSPVLTPLEFFLWGYVIDLSVLRVGIRETIAAVPMNMLDRT
jgi:hypothetical protein